MPPDAGAGSCSINHLNLLLFIVFSVLCSITVGAQQTNTYPGFNESEKNTSTPDSGSRLEVVSIIINGNKKTKSYIILREMKFKAGDFILAGRLAEVMEQSRALVYNTSLFSEVTVSPLLTSATELIVKVTVLEKLYIYPSPQFKLVDRNVNEWLKTYNANLNRVTYGLKFAHYNLSGRGDKLRVYGLNGYARSLSFSYSAPYSNGALTEGFSIGAGYSQNREFPYKMGFDNRLLQFKKTGFVKDNFYVSTSYQRRRGYFKRHIFSLAYNFIRVNDSIILPQYNPAYFNSEKSRAGFPDMQYSYQYSNTNNVNYPLRGRTAGFAILKRGLGFRGGINMLAFDGSYALFIPHKKNWYTSIETTGTLKLPFKQAYINQNALGYRDLYLRGLEYYVVDGVAAAVAKYSLRKKIISFSIPVPFHIKKVPTIPFSIYAKTYADLGYSYNKDQFSSRLGNKLLYTGGFGLDILSLYDTTLKLEYSFNQLGQNGLFLHANSLF